MSGEFEAARLASGGPEELTRATGAAIATARAGIERFKAAEGAPDALLDIFDEANAALSNLRELAGMIAKAHPEEAVRTAADAAEQEIDKVATDISLDRGVYDALAAIDLGAADKTTRYWVEKTLREFRRAGVDRDDATRARVRELQEELVGIGQDFDRNIRSDTRTATVAPSALDGLPDDYVRAHPPGEDGLVRITTEYPDIIPFLTYATSADAREELWRLFQMRGHPANIEVLDRLVERRHELATLLGYPSWAQYVTENKMIGSADAAGDFIDRIASVAAGRLGADLATLLERKRADDPEAAAVDPWDNAYLQDRVKAERFAFDSQAMRPYFEYDRVKVGLMGLTERLFGVTFTRREDAPVWHPDVEAYDVARGGVLIGRIFLDMHPRADKYNHAAMFTMVNGKAGVRIPECALLCNLPKPGAEPALLQHNEVSTFFHEFGHLIHHIFAGHTRWAGVGGISTEWDFVEAPSQLLEEWTLDAPTLALFAVHHETGEPLPAELVEKLRAAEEFGKGIFVRQQMFYAAVSLEIYRRDPATFDIAELKRELQAKYAPFPEVPGTWFHLSFGHLDGYSAIYYTYMWSLVIAKDLFTVFKREGLLDSETAGRYRDAVLAPGGSAPAAELVRDFLGREYTFDAYQAWLNS
ncbi:M3 family metallopeptidase [Luedemannella flava]|uniref:M3 family metallopeptidase n=1 Tax=Luedemannella flava TaxID=349316 RepID=A0ABP4YWY5_9ACTN